MTTLVAAIELIIATYLVFVWRSYRKDHEDAYNMRLAYTSAVSREQLLMKRYIKLCREKSELEKDNIELRRQLSGRHNHES